jgi:predicted RND superfamily exporter protein
MKTIYIKTKSDKPFSSPYYWKIVELGEELTLTMQVTKDSIQVDDDDDFHAQVSFVKKTLCEDEGHKEITRQEFKEFFDATNSKINNLIKI